MLVLLPPLSNSQEEEEDNDKEDNEDNDDDDNEEEEYAAIAAHSGEPSPAPSFRTLTKGSVVWQSIQRAGKVHTPGMKSCCMSIPSQAQPHWATAWDVRNESSSSSMEQSSHCHCRG